MNNSPVYLMLDALSSWAWQVSLAATALILLVWMIERTARKLLPAQWLYALWLCVLLRLIVPMVPSTAFSIFNLGTTLSFGKERAAVPALSQRPSRSRSIWSSRRPHPIEESEQEAVSSPSQLLKASDCANSCPSFGSVGRWLTSL